MTLIRVRIVVAVRQPPVDLLRLAVEQPHADIDGVVVVEHADLGALGRRLPSSGSRCVKSLATSACDHASSDEPPVDDGRLDGAHGVHGPPHRRRWSGSLLRVNRRATPENQCQGADTMRQRILRRPLAVVAVEQAAEPAEDRSFFAAAACRGRARRR